MTLNAQVPEVIHFCEFLGKDFQLIVDEAEVLQALHFREAVREVGHGTLLKVKQLEVL